MRDPVAEVLLERAALDRDASVGVAISILLHAGLTALAIYAALNAPAPQTVRMVNIQFASTPATAAPPAAAPQPVAPAPQPAQPRIEEPKPVIAEPKPPVTQPVAKPEKNTVPISPFGRSTKKGSETPAAAPPTPPPASAGPATGIGTADVPVGGAGVTGLEGGDFPYTLYIDGMQRRIGGNWFRPQVSPGTAAVIYFRIQRDGTITDPRIQTPSGNSAFDRAALSAVRSSTPLNPLPFAYNGNYLGVHLTFR
jgi:TonB family protein